MRQSRLQHIVDGSLKGIKAKEYYQLQDLYPRKIFISARKYMPENLWTKLDRRKPISRKNSQVIKEAINQAAVEQVKDFPFTTPIIETEEQPYRRYRFSPPEPNKFIFTLRSVKIVNMENRPSSQGTVYFASTHGSDVTLDNQSGRIGFSRHAIERLLERCPDIVSFAKKERCDAVLHLLYVFVKKERIRQSETGYMLTALPFGCFPMTYDYLAKCWICTSFLTTDMNGLPTQPDLISSDVLGKLVLKHV